jgi:hypothetical protein
MGFLLRCFVYTLASIFVLMSDSSKLVAQELTDVLKRQVEAQAAIIAAMEKRLDALEQNEIVCLAGKQVTGAINRWSPISSCPETYAAMGIERLDLAGNHDLPNLHVNDLWCDQKGCKAWCIGATCTVVTKCCKWQPSAAATKK